MIQTFIYPFIHSIIFAQPKRRFTITFIYTKKKLLTSLNEYLPHRKKAAKLSFFHLIHRTIHHFIHRRLPYQKGGSFITSFTERLPHRKGRSFITSFTVRLPHRKGGSSITSFTERLPHRKGGSFITSFTERLPTKKAVHS